MKVKIPGFNTTVKFVLFLLLVSIFPLLMVGFISYNTSRSVIQEEVSNYTQALVVRQKDYLELLLETIESLIANVSGVEEIKKALLDDESTSDTYARLATHASIGYILNGYLNLDGLVAIDIFTLNGAHYHVGDTLSTANIDTTTYQRIFDEALQSDRIVLWTGVEKNINTDSTHEKVITAAKVLKIVDAERLQEEPLGLLVVTYSTDAIYEQFSQRDLGEGAYMMIIDTKNRLIYHPNKKLIGSKIAPSFTQQFTGDQGSFTQILEGQEMLVTYTISDVSGWSMVSLIPVETLTASANTIREATFMALLVLFGFISLAAIVVTRTTVVPIKRITELFKQIQAGTFDGTTRFNVKRDDEIGELLRWFDEFLDSMEAKKQAEQQLLEAKEAAESANQRITALYEQLSNENERLEKTLTELQLTQEELVKSEKLAALGQLVAGVAHEVNTPLGAIRAAISNTTDILNQSLQQLPRLFQILSAEQQEHFFLLLERSLNATERPIAREVRKYKRQLCKMLEDAEVEESDMIADLLVDMEIYRDIEPFIPLFREPEINFVIQMAYDLSGLQKNGYTISVAVERASKVVFALKNYARYDHSGAKVDAVVIDGIETVLTLYHNQLKQGIEVKRSYEDIPPIACYPDELNQVWTNLIHNAIQAMANKGTLEVCAKQVNNHIEISMTDSGSGIAPEIQARIFEPFFTTKPAGEGSGLGLGIVQKIIQKHDGTIEVDSEPGKTTFRVQLPIQHNG